MILDAYKNTAQPLVYNTRDGEGLDITKHIDFKTFIKKIKKFNCAMCGQYFDEGIELKEVISARFTDFNILKNNESNYVCESCSLGVNLIKYSYIIDDKIKLLNIREMNKAIQCISQTPFIVCISKSQKKHLFYRAVINYDTNNFIVQFETESIKVNRLKLIENIEYIENLQVLNQSKVALETKELHTNIILKCGEIIYNYLIENIKQRQFFIALHLAQKKEITEEQAICNLKAICKTYV